MVTELRCRVCALAIFLAFVFGFTSRAHAQDLVGPGTFDFRLGPSFGVLDSDITQFRLDVEFGYCLTKDWRNHIYIVAPFDFGFGGGQTVISMLPGVEADINLPGGQPIYLYPKLGLGLGIATGGGNTDFGFGLRFGFGVKYVLAGMWNFAFEPFNLEIYPVGFTGTPGLYNLMFSAGLNF